MSSSELSAQEEARGGDDGKRLPYTFNTITESIAQYAREHLNETPERKIEALKQLKEIIKKERNIDGEDDPLYLGILRSRKFDVHKSAAVAIKAIDYGLKYKYLADRSDKDIVERFIQANMIGFLPYRDAENRAVFYARAEAWDPDEMPMLDAIFASIVSLSIASENQLDQVFGYVCIIDMEGMTMKQIIAGIPWLRIGIQAIQVCCPMQIKHIHVTNAPKIFKFLSELVKSLIIQEPRSQHLFSPSRISIHEESWYDITKAIPSELLPSEFGGTLGNLSNDHWASDIDDMMKRYYQKASHLNLTVAKEMKQSGLI